MTHKQVIKDLQEGLKGVTMTEDINYYYCFDCKKEIEEKDVVNDHDYECAYCPDCLFKTDYIAKEKQ